MELNEVQNVKEFSQLHERTIDFLNEEAWSKRESSSQQAMDLANEAFQKSTEINYNRGKAFSLLNLAVCNRYLSNYYDSLNYCLEAKPLFELLKEKNGLASVYSCIGTDYFEFGDYENSLHFHLHALKLRQELKNAADQSSSLFNIAGVYASIKDYDNALDYYSRSEKIARELSDKTNWTKILNGIGGLHMMRSDFEKAIECYIQSVNIKKEIGKIRSTASTLHNMGDCYIDMKEFDQARECLKDSMKIAVDYGDRKIEGTCMQTFGRLLLFKNQYPEAIDRLTRSLLIFEDLEAVKEQADCHHYLAETYKRIKKFEKALDHLDKHYSLKEKVSIQEWAKKIEKMNLLHQMEDMRRESEIEHLKNVELKTANQQIEDKNRNILDSIDYAKFIQETLLPRKETIQQSFIDSFVFVKPKDIVSGDFYLHYRIDNLVLLAVVDCTGHGVPGAFMSLAANNMIDNIIEVQKIHTPAQILMELNNAIALKFNKNQESMSLKSGMDIALCSIDLKNLEINFAGAHNSIYVIRENNLQEFKADKIYLGDKPDQSISQHKSQLQKNDCVYLFSDGFADQKGGDKGTKFYYPPFKQLLVEISKMKMQDQYDTLQSKLDNWKGTRPQIDDITVIGLRIT